MSLNGFFLLTLQFNKISILKQCNYDEITVLQKM